MSKNPGKNFLNVHYVSDIVQTLTIASHVPQETDSGMEVQWDVISSPTPEKDEGRRTGQRKKWSDDAVSTEASASSPMGSLLS